MLPYIDLSEIDIKAVKSMEFERHDATITFIDGSFIKIEFDTNEGMDYSYWDADGKYYRINA